MIKHVLSASQFTPQMLQLIFTLADKMGDFWTQQVLTPEKDQEDFLQTYGMRGRRMALLFYEVSTRTQASFSMAWEFLGGSVPFSTTHARVFSSAAKGESLEDTVRVLASFGPHVIILRHPEEGAAARAAEAIDVRYPYCSIINAGDGPGEHPTQALLDLYTIHKLFGKIDGRKLALMGDVGNSRTIRSLVKLLRNYQGLKLYFCSPGLTRMRESMREELRQAKIDFEELTESWEDLITEKRVEIFYQTRLQAERFADQALLEAAQQLQPKYTVTERIGRMMEERDIFLMHPLPRVNEIETACDQFNHAFYYSQAQNGMFVRMALPVFMFGKVPELRKVNHVLAETRT